MTLKKNKKLLLVITAVLISLFMPACGEPWDLYETAAKKFDNAEGIIIRFSSGLTVSEGVTEAKSSFEGEMKINHGQDGYSMSLTGELVISPDEGGRAVEVKAYYQNGRYYSQMAGSKYYTDLSWEEVLEQVGLCTFASALTREDFQAISTDDSGEDTTVEYVISPEKAVKIYGLAGRWERFSNQGSKENVISLREVTGKVVLDGSEPESQSFLITGTVIDGDRVRNVTNTIFNEFELYSDPVKVDIPDASGFTELER